MSEKVGQQVEGAEEEGIYESEGLDESMDDDMITSREGGFMRGYLSA